MPFTVAIVGRPNVGKSTLFNRLIGQKLALTDNQPGVTRDRREHRARLQNLSFNLIDTAGLEDGSKDSLAGRMRNQTHEAIKESDIILFMVDARADLTATDYNFAEIIRKIDKPVVFLANKTENKKILENFPNMWRLGLGEPLGISAEHSLGMEDLYHAIVKILTMHEKLNAKIKEFKDIKKEKSLKTENLESDENLENQPEILKKNKTIKIAIVGRPNVGKSTFINYLLGSDRLLTGPEAGLTRDSICVNWTWRGHTLKLYDTAGLRRKSKVQNKLEKLSVGDTLRAIRFADIVVLMIDALSPFEKQDLQIADFVEREGRALIIAFNKWDQITENPNYLASLREESKKLLPQLMGVRIVAVSGKFGKGIEKLMENIFSTYDIWNQRVSTAPLNKWLEHAIASHPPPAIANRRLKIKYITQIKARPPTFVLACSKKEAMTSAYLRYLTKGLRQNFNFSAVPIRIILKSSDNPYTQNEKKI